jgi:hypothetical protein
MLPQQYMDGREIGDDHERFTFSEAEQQQATQTRKKWATSAIVAGLMSAALVGAFVMGTRVGKSTEVSAMPQPLQLAQIVAKPPYDQCSTVTENCKQTRCCKVTGYDCFYTNKAAGVAKCMKKCTPGKDGDCDQTELVPLVDANTKHLPELFCFTVYTADSGSTKPNYELQLLKMQYAGKYSIFDCKGWGVYSDVEAEFGDGKKTVKVEDNGDFHFEKRKDTGTWVNTGLFSQVWKKIHSEGNAKDQDWVVKADLDAVFIPSRLQAKVSEQLVPDQGLYYENCKFVEYGYFGNLEVFSKRAWATLMENVDDCYTSVDWKKGIKDGKYGPMGEDLFAQVCMDKHGVKKVENFEISTDGACPGDRPKDQQKNKKWIPPCAGTVTPSIHPFKKPADWKKCYDETTGRQSYGN